MGNKKRGLISVEEEASLADLETSSAKVDGSDEHVKKKLNKDRKKKERRISEPGSDSAPSMNTNPILVPPMERKKKRKAMDKEKHRLDNGEVPKPKLINFEPDKVVAVSTNLQRDGGGGGGGGAGGGLPEFHIGVFKELGSANVSVREAAAETLVAELVEIQKAYERLENEKKEIIEDGLKLEEEKDDGLSNYAPSLRYAIRRLIRGVSSSRECARQGFALGLSILVGSVPGGIRLDSVMTLIVDLLEISSSMKGQEIKHCLLGRLFAYGALTRSGRLIEEGISDKNSQQIKEFISSLIALASKKRYLQEPAVMIILELVEKLPAEAVLKHVIDAPGMHEWFEKASEDGNPDALLLALKLREQLSVDNKVFGKLLPYPYSSGRIFSADQLSSLTNCLKESTFCQPRVHSVWPVLVNILLPDVALQYVDSVSGLNSTKKHKKNRKPSSSHEDIENNLRCFWEIVVERTLLLSSHDRKHLAFDVLLLLLPRLPVSCIPVVLSYKLVQCLMDVLSTRDSWLYKVARHFIKQLSDWVEHDEARRVAVIVALQKHSNGKFDCITRTKTVKGLMASFKTESGCMLFIQNLMSMFLDEGQTSEEPSDQSQTRDDNSEIRSMEDKDSGGTIGTLDFLKSWVVDSLPSVLKHIKLDSDAKFRVRKEVLKFLAVQGLFCSSLGTEVTSFELEEKFRWPKAATSTALCMMCIEQLQLLLADAQKEEAPHTVVTGPEMNDICSYFIRFLSTLRNIPSVSLFRSLSNEDEKVFKKLQAMEGLLSRKERKYGLYIDGYRVHALRYLLIQLLLQLLLRPGEFSEAALELVICGKKLFVLHEELDSSGDDELDDAGIPELMDVLVDTLLSLLPQSSAPMRSAIEQVFKYFHSEVTTEGLQRMLRVIKKDLKPARRQETDSEGDETDDDLLDIEEAEESDEDEDEDEDEADTGENSESDEETDDEPEARVGFNKPAVGKEFPEASDDDSDGGMDDEAMFRMDSYLAQIFKEKRNQASGETAHSQLVLFKLRVLSLLEIYLHEVQGFHPVMKIFSCLAEAFINPHTTEGSEQLGQRIWGILQKKIFKAKRYPKGIEVYQSMLEALLEKNLKLASKPFKRKKYVANPSKKKQSASFTRRKMITSLAQNSIYWLLKIVDASNYSESQLQKVLDILKGTLVAYFDSKKSQMKPELLKEILRRWPWIGHHFLGFLLEKCGNAKSQFRQVEALDLVIEILKPRVGDSADEGKVVTSNLPKLCHLVKELVSNMPEKQSRRADVRKFCGKIFNILRSLKLTASFLETFEPSAYAACETQLGKPFLDLKRQEGLFSL